MLRFNVNGPNGLIDRKAAGPKILLTESHRQALAAQVGRGQSPVAQGVVRWRPCELGQWFWDEFRSVSRCGR